MYDNRYGREVVEPLDGQSEEELAQRAKDEELDRLRTDATERDKQIAAQNARIDQMDRDVSRRFAENRQVAAPQANDMYATQQELNIKDEELLDPATAPAAIRKIAEHQAKKIAAEQDARYGAEIGSQAATLFDLQMDRLSTRGEFYEDLEPLVREYFQDNPNEINVAGKIEEVYERLVGKNYALLKERHKDDKDGGLHEDENDSTAAKARYRQQSRVVDAPVQTASPSGRAEGQGKKKVVLDEAREFERKRWEGLGIEMTAEEWVDIESGKKYPKKKSTDIQVGLSQPNVDYEG